jgi:DNA polymerase III subunit epsilon
MLYLQAEPARSAAIAADVLGIQRSPPVVSERLATALLGADPRIKRLPDGRWDLVRDAGKPPLIADCTFAVVDVETTGGQARGRDRITEVAVVLLHRGRYEVVLDTLINPERHIPRAVTAVTRITSEDVRDKPIFDEVVDEVIAALSGRVFVAHNVRFDWGFLAASIKRCRDYAIDGPRLCTVRLAKRLIPGLASRALDSVAAYFGIEIAQRHRAGADAVATARVLARLLDRAEEAGASTLRDLEYLCRPRAKRKRKRPSARALPEPLEEI